MLLATCLARGVVPCPGWPNLLPLIFGCAGRVGRYPARCCGAQPPTSAPSPRRWCKTWCVRSTTEDGCCCCECLSSRQSVCQLDARARLIRIAHERRVPNGLPLVWACMTAGLGHRLVPRCCTADAIVGGGVHDDLVVFRDLEAPHPQPQPGGHARLPGDDLDRSGLCSDGSAADHGAAAEVCTPGRQTEEGVGVGGGARRY
jgi:hypothetical protein